MDAIGLNPIKLDAIGLDPVRMNAIRLGVPGASSGSGRPYIDPELLSHVKMAISTWGKSNDDPDRTVLKDLSGNGNDMRLLNFGFTEGSGYGLSGTDFEGWLCTDGVDDIIESVKTLEEMGISSDFTVLSIYHTINKNTEIGGVVSNSLYYDSHIYNITQSDDCICGYSVSLDNSNVQVINNILGDKNKISIDHQFSSDDISILLHSKFNLFGINNGGIIMGTSSGAYAGGFIANKVLTTDEINQIIAYYNLDRPGQIIKPQLYYNIKKQGITNENHAEFNDQLIDFVGGHNIQLNNIGWEGESGINSYPVIFGNNKTWSIARPESDKISYDLTSNKITIYKTNNNSALLFAIAYENGVVRNRTVPAFKLKVTGLTTGQEIHYKYVSESNKAVTSTIILTEDGTYDMPQSYKMEPNESTVNSWIGFLTNIIGDCNVTLEVLPTIENALCLDGISDFGKATGLPVLKDYTVVADREAFLLKGGIVSKSNDGSNGAFIFNNSDTVNDYTYSFGSVNSLDDKDYSRKILYQSKYIYNGSPIKVGTSVDSDSMWLGTIRDGDSRFSKLALWSLMLFPYSLSEFLLERQLRKYKAGTLYPDMIEFRPVIKSNVPYSSVSYSVNPGEYIAEGSTVTITVTLSNASDKLIGVSSNAISDISISGDNGTYAITGKVTKSPQKINIVISSYLTMLNNDTLISNETLIKNK